MIRSRVLLTAAALLLFSGSASAALTSSEKGQIKDFVAGARAENAQKVRSLVARTDLAADESISVLSDAVVPVPFTEARGTFLKELVFGASSAPSRPVLTLATVKALLARADSITQRYVGGLDHEPQAIGELAAIYAWLDGAIANAGSATTKGHDSGAGIPAATYDECSKAVRDHLDHNARWLKGDGAVPETVTRLRAQAQVMLIDMLPDGLTRRVEAADRLGLHGARKALLTESGILFADSGKTDDTKIEKMRQYLSHLPVARDSLSVIYTGDDRATPLKARGSVLFVGVANAPYPFEGPPPATYDPASSAFAHDLAVLVAKRALETNGELRQQAERDATAATATSGHLLGRVRAPSVEHVLGGAIHALVIDATKAIDLAFARMLGGRAESAALLSDALGALAVSGTRVELGKAGAWAPASPIKLAPNGAAIGFTFDGHAWTIDRASPSYAVMGARRDGTPVNPSQLSTAGIPRDGTEWASSGYTFTRLRGAPRVAVSPGVNLKLLASPGDDFDAIGVLPVPADYVIEGELAVKNGPGGIVIRSATTKKGVRGAALLVTPGGKTTLAAVDDGTQTNLAAPIDSDESAVKFRISVKGNKVEAAVGKATLAGTLPDSLAKGDVALIAKRGATVDIASFSIKKQ